VRIAERGWRDMKQVIDLRPVFHRHEDRIRAFVLLCWLALLLARITENACGGRFRGPDWSVGSDGERIGRWAAGLAGCVGR
jgi:hypothetical protein